jgi:4-hydroxy-tetrahydrodipicolinate reductase
MAASDLELVAVVDPGKAGSRLGDVLGPAGDASAAGASAAGASSAGGSSGAPASLEISSDAESLAGARADVAVDFTVASAARDNLRWCADHGVHAVSGTTGFSEADLGQFGEWFGPSSSANALVAANFSLGAVLMMRCAELCAPYFEGIEIIELHHEHKRDAPSGTSLATARRLEAARSAAGSGPLSADPTELEVIAGTRGGVTAGGVHVHSVRLPGYVAHQQVIFGSPGETLTLRHDSTDRVSFMPGVLLAIRKVGALDGLTVGLDSLLDG